MTRLVLPILVAAGIVWPARAFADEPISAREKAQSKKAYQHALQLYKAERYQEAASELRKAYEYAPLPPILFNLGITYIQLGQKAAARAALHEYLSVLPQSPNRSEGGGAPGRRGPGSPGGRPAAAPGPGGGGRPRQGGQAARRDRGRRRHREPARGHAARRAPDRAHLPDAKRAFRSDLE